MKTIEQIAAKYAVLCSEIGDDKRRLDIFKDCITAALYDHEAAAPQVDWENAVDWPDEPGLWLYQHSPLLACEWVWAGPSESGDEHCFVTNSRNTEIDYYDGGKSYGPMTPPLPAPPKPPSPWDYIPKDGDYVWVSDGVVYDGARRIIAGEGGLFIKPPPGSFKTVAECRKHNYRFAKAEVSPAPPEAL